MMYIRKGTGRQGEILENIRLEKSGKVSLLKLDKVEMDHAMGMIPIKD